MNVQNFKKNVNVISLDFKLMTYIIVWHLAFFGRKVATFKNCSYSLIIWTIWVVVGMHDRWRLSPLIINVFDRHSYVWLSKTSSVTIRFMPQNVIAVRFGLKYKWEYTNIANMKVDWSSYTSCKFVQNNMLTRELRNVWPLHACGHQQNECIILYKKEATMSWKEGQQSSCFGYMGWV
jgi:hypothetical protein